MNKEHNTIEDIEYLLTALENGVDADDYWREISDLRATLKKVTLFVHQPEQPEPVYWENEKKALLNEIDHLTNRLAQPERKSFSDEEITKAFTKFVFGTWDSKSYRSGFKDAEKVHGITGVYDAI